MSTHHVTTPLSDEQVETLTAGDQVLITGTLYTARDAAHKRLVEALDAGADLPLDLAGQVVYYVGPTPARPGMPIGSAGPTTSGRMDRYTPKLLSAGMKGMIGKGYRDAGVRDAIIKFRAVYFAAIGGSGALLARHITTSTIVAFEDLGAEAIHQLTVMDFPTFVINDCHGNDLYEMASAQYQEE